MATVTVDLPDEMSDFVEAQATEHGHASAGEYLLALIRDAQIRQAKRGLDAKLLEALESGTAEPMTGADWEDLERRVWERHHRERSGS